MKYVFIIAFIFLGCEKERKFVEIPYKTTSPFFSMDLITVPYYNYIKKNGIKSIGLKRGGKAIDDFIVFNQYGFIESTHQNTGQKIASYMYDSDKLVKITNSGRMYNIDNPEYIEFKYDGSDRVIHVNSHNSEYRHNVEVGYFYFKDSTEIITYDSIPKFWLEKTVFIQNASGQTIKEKQYRFNELWCHIDYTYDKDNTLNAKIWYMKGEKVQIDSIKNGLVILSITDLDTCRYEYLPNEIKSCWGENLYIKKW